MKFLTFVTLILFVVASVHSEQPKKKKPSWFEKIFQTAKPTPAPKPKKKKTTKTTTKAKPKNGAHTVDADWMARYLDQEAIWRYEIPEDEKIEFKDGSYRVPASVFQHYEDMLATPPRPSPTPKPSPSPKPNAIL